MKFKYETDFEKRWEVSKAMGKHLQKDFPGLEYYKDFNQYGCECNPGWFNHIWDTIQLIHDISKEQDTPVKITQIKEKFGMLRIYIHNGNEKCNEILRIAENKSAHICDICGNPGKLYTEGWYKTRCDIHKDLGR